MNTEDHWLWITSIPGIYRNHIKALIDYFGGPQEVFEAPETEFRIWKKIGFKWVDALLKSRRKTPDQIRREMRGKGVDFISTEHPSFPSGLKNISDYPFGIYYKGSLPPEQMLLVAVVGARACDAYGRVNAQRIGEALAGGGVCTVSGMAAGIDGHVLSAASLAGGKCCAVLGCGPDICYPPSHAMLYDRLCREGCVISEHPCGTPPLKAHFPARNRIISGLSKVTVVVQARERSGSLITADHALDQGREVYAVPGRTCDQLSTGCNRLIQSGAGVVVSAESFLSILKSEFPGYFGEDNKAHKTDSTKGCKNYSKTDSKTDNKTESNTDSGSCRPKLTLGARKIFSLMGMDLMGAEELMEAAGMELGQVTDALLELELEGYIRQEGKGRYVAADHFALV